MRIIACVCNPSICSSGALSNSSVFRMCLELVRPEGTVVLTAAPRQLVGRL